MRRIFPEEIELRKKLSDEWQEEVKDFLGDVWEVFCARGQSRDSDSVVWDRLHFPEGFTQVINQKATRIPPLLEAEEPDWDKVLSELEDVASYCAIFGAIIRMLKRRKEQ